MARGQNFMIPFMAKTIIPIIANAKTDDSKRWQQ
jgi:hypothetical protein